VKREAPGDVGKNWVNGAKNPRAKHPKNKNKRSVGGKGLGRGRGGKEAKQKGLSKKNNHP